MAYVSSGKKSNIFRNISFTTLGLVGLAFLGLNLVRSYQSNHQVNQEISGLQQNIQDLEKDNLELKELIEYFNSNAYVEEKARIDLGLKKSGEKVVVISEQREQGAESSPASNSDAVENASNIEKWWIYFFN